MRYVNKVTGTVIDTKSEISGGDWEPAEEKKKDDTRKTVRGKKESDA